MTFSPIEVFRGLAQTRLDPAIVAPASIAVGPLNDAQQDAGGISIVDAGQGNAEVYLPLIRPRFQMRCVAPTLARCEEIGWHVAFTLHNLPPRIVAPQASSADLYLVHVVAVSSGPSAHRDTEGTWEYLVHADTMMGTEPVE